MSSSLRVDSPNARGKEVKSGSTAGMGEAQQS